LSVLNDALLSRDAVESRADTLRKVPNESDPEESAMSQRSICTMPSERVTRHHIGDRFPADSQEGGYLGKSRRTHMLPLTSDTWSGLRLFRCGHDDEIRQFDVDVDTARLLFWNSGGTEVLIRSGRSKRRHFITQPGRLDLYAVETFEEIRVGPTLTDFADDWTPGTFEHLLDIWPRFGIQRHFNTVEPADIASVVVHALTAPAHARHDTIEVQPVAPLCAPDLP